MVLRFARAIVRLPVRKRAPSPRIYAPPGAIAKGAIPGAAGPRGPGAREGTLAAHLVRVRRPFLNPGLRTGKTRGRDGGDGKRAGMDRNGAGLHSWMARVYEWDGRTRYVILCHSVPFTRGPGRRLDGRRRDRRAQGRPSTGSGQVRGRGRLGEAADVAVGGRRERDGRSVGEGAWIPVSAHENGEGGVRGWAVSPIRPPSSILPPRCGEEARGGQPSTDSTPALAAQTTRGRGNERKWAQTAGFRPKT